MTPQRTVHVHYNACTILDTGLKYHTRKSSEDRINSFPQYTTEIEGLAIHFVGLFSERKDAVPILLLHGWPGRSIAWP